MVFFLIGLAQARAEAVGDLGPRRTVPVPTARQPLGSAEAASGEDQQGAPARGPSRKKQQGGPPTRFQLPVPKRHSPEVLSIDLHTVHCSTALCEALEQHACIVSSSSVMHIALLAVSLHTSHVEAT